MLRTSECRGHHSYFEAFIRRRNVTSDVAAREALLTDRGAYLNFLEVQLERVSAACLTAQDIGARVDGFAARASSAEEKVMSATKLIRLAQTYSEEQGREQARINDGFESRLEEVERRLDGLHVARASPPLPPPSPRGGHAEQNEARPANTPPTAVFLSEWMLRVDRQLDCLRSLLTPPGCRAADDETAAEMRNSHASDRRTAVDKSSSRTCCSKEARVAGGGNESPRQSSLEGATPPDGSSSPAKLAPQTTSADLVSIEERVRRVEAHLGTGAPCHDAGSSQAATTGDPTVMEVADKASSRGRRLERCAELAQEGLSRSRSRSRSPSPRARSACADGDKPGRASAVDAATSRMPAKELLLDAVQQGATEARRASELAKEALQAGREAVGRCQRSENLAEALATFALKGVKPDREYVGIERGRLSLDTGPDQMGTCAPGPDPPAPGVSNDASTRPRSLLAVRSMLEDATAGVGDQDGRRGRSRLALGAARTALECILREVSPNAHGSCPEGDRGRFVAVDDDEIAARAGTCGLERKEDKGELRQADELRGAIRGAVNILAGISGEEQRRSSGCSRRSRRGGRRVSRARDGPGTTNERANRRLAGYWIPPGNIPCKIWERKAGAGVSRAAEGISHAQRDPRAQDGDDETVSPT